MSISKVALQRELEATLEEGKYTEKLGELIMIFADVTVHKKGLNFRFTRFEVDFIIRPKIVDMLLIKTFGYRKNEGSAYAFFNLVTKRAIDIAIKAVNSDRKGNYHGVYYIEDVKKELMNTNDESDSGISELFILNNKIETRDE